MAAELLTAPVEEPVTLAEAKAHMRVEVTNEDTLISSLIVSARQWAEIFTRRAFVTQTWKAWFDAFPPFDGSFELPYPRVKTITAIKYTAPDGTLTTLSNLEYQVDVVTEPARIVPVYGMAWPVPRIQLNAVSVEYVTGFGGAVAVPEGIKRAILFHVAHCYENREPVDKAGCIETVERMLNIYRVFRFG